MEDLEIKVNGNQINIKFIRHLEKSQFNTYLTKIKKIPGATFLSQDKKWSVPFNQESIEKVKELFNISLEIETKVEDKGSYDFCEVFPINEGIIPQLNAYELKISGNNLIAIGGKLSYSLRQEFEGHWVWTDFKVVSDKLIPKEDLMNFIEKLWKAQPDIYKDLLDINVLERWIPSNYVKAAFMVKGLMADYEVQIKKILKKDASTIGKANIERTYQKRGWVVGDQPALSITVKSELIYSEDVNSIVKDFDNPNKILGLFVRDKNTTAKGQVVEILGTMKDHRKRLLTITSNPRTLKLIADAPDEELIIKIETKSGNRNTYDYTASALQVILYDQDFKKFNIDGSRALKIMQIEPQKRSNLVMEIAEVFLNQNWIKEAYNSKKYPKNFVNPEILDYHPLVMFGDQKPIRYEDRNVVRELQQRGIYKINKQKIQIAAINGLSNKDVKPHVDLIMRNLKLLKISPDIVAIQKIKEFSHLHLQEIIEELDKKNPDIIISYVPDSLKDTYYHLLKTLTLSRDIDTQVVERSTIDNNYALGNIILGILGKVGNIPYVLAESLTYVDYIVGIDIAHKKKHELAGTINATAITRIYMNNGELMRYFIHDAPIEGEAIPDTVLRLLFPPKEFQNKRTIIHRDGYFRKDEIKTLNNWATQINATFLLVEVIKSGSPRIYHKEKGSVVSPSKGDAFILSSNEAFLVSSLPAFKRGTPRPLHIRSIDSFPINQALHSILSLTILHYGSLKAPKLPVSIHYSDKIAYLALRGVKPKKVEGNRPFWL